MFFRNVGWPLPPFTVISQKMEIFAFPPIPFPENLEPHCCITIWCKRDWTLSKDNATLIMKAHNVLDQFYLYVTRIIRPTGHTPKIREHSRSTHSVCPYVRVAPPFSVRLLDIRYALFPALFHWLDFRSMAIVFRLWADIFDQNRYIGLYW
jgi:hypothetical protein